MNFRSLFLSLFGVSLILVFAGGLQAAKMQKNLKKVPDWVVDLSRASVPDYDSDPNFVCLLDTMTFEINDEGEMISKTRYAIKLLKKEGFDDAIAYASYSEDTDKVKKFEAWVVHDNNQAVLFGKSDITDRTSKQNWQIASSGRYQYLDARRDVKVGSVFAFESTIVGTNIFTRQSWYFQGEEPRLRSGIRFKVPEGWEIKSLFFNMDPLDPVESGGYKAWEMRNIAGLERQDFAPLNSELVPWATFSIFPSANAKLKRPVHVHRSWKELSTEMTQQYLAKTYSSEAISQKVRELTAAGSDNWSKIKPLAEYARSVNYVAESLDLGSGGGFVPRTADEIYSTNWGDCKDKATLLCSMLGDVEIKAFPLIVNAESRDTIYEEWPSGLQFNHCIIAISVDEEVSSDSIVEHPVHGRLLIYDPTSEMTSVGDLPQQLQGSKGILLAGETGGLIDLPVVRPENSVTKRWIQAEVFDNGGLLAKLHEESKGQEGRGERRVYRSEERLSEYRDRLQSWMANYAPAARLSEPEVEDDLDTGVFEMKVDFASPGYGKAMGGALVTFKPVILDRRSDLAFSIKKKRTQPMILNPDHLDEIAEIFIPVGFKVSEFPEAISLKEDFGTYEASVEIGEEMVILKRKLWINENLIPVEDFDKAKAFFESIISFEQSPVVLERAS
ncbi:hypothetical protein VDG1235_2743 [Verrucomicrobiia bacterium DG1235]|nr:hypothetical protein VDG1235_2743 [Verrucomicrobiae bacterium DG1235]